MASSTTINTNQLTQDILPDIRLREPSEQLESTGELVATSVTLRPAPFTFFNLTRFGAGIIADIRARAPWYLSDWTDAWNYRVIPATALIFFAK